MKKDIDTIIENVIPGCESFHIEKGDTAFLLIHGLCGSPYEVSKLSDYLVKHNYSTCAPRYPGHGTKGKIMDKFDWRDWYNEVERNYLKLIKKYSKVYVIGFSTGGTLTLKLATNYDIPKIAVVSTFIETTKKWYFLFKPESYLNTVGKLLNYVPTLIPPPNLSDPIARKEYIKPEYISLNAIRSTLELVESMKNNMYQVTSPILIIHSKNDITTSPTGAQFVYDNVSSISKELVWVEKSNHILLLDYEKEYIFDRIKYFFEK